jgi:O-antigen/teichoic acid export membrane protein
VSVAADTVADAPSPGEQAAARVAGNTLARAAAEVVGKLASLALLVGLARAEGPRGLGVLVLALAWAEIAVTAVDLGFDRYFLRCVARDPDALHRMFFNVLRLKAVRAVPVFAVVVVGTVAVGYDETTRAAVLIFFGVTLLDSVSYTLASVFTAHERGDLTASVLVLQRLISAAVGGTALLLGGGVLAVALAYAVASVVGVAMGTVLLRRHIGRPARVMPAEPRADLRRNSIPFAAQEVFAVGITRVDTVLLSALAAASVVGLYGAAYRLFESTLLITNAVVAAFAAMFTYLTRDGSPSVTAVYGRALWLTLALMTPCAVLFGVLAEPLLALLFGAGFGGAAGPLRVLAATAVLLGVVLISLSLVVSRRRPSVIVPWFGVALAVNVVLNLALIPPLGATGAALGMLGTELLLAIGMVRLALQQVGPLSLVRTVAAPLAGAAVMAPVALALAWSLPLALVAGVSAYAATLVAVEARVSPEDLRAARGMARRRLSAAAAARKRPMRGSSRAA